MVQTDLVTGRICTSCGGLVSPWRSRGSLSGVGMVDLWVIIFPLASKPTSLSLSPSAPKSSGSSGNVLSKVTELGSTVKSLIGLFLTSLDSGSVLSVVVAITVLVDSVIFGGGVTFGWYFTVGIGCVWLFDCFLSGAAPTVLAGF